MPICRSWLPGRYCLAVRRPRPVHCSSWCYLGWFWGYSWSTQWLLPISLGKGGSCLFCIGQRHCWAKFLKFLNTTNWITRTVVGVLEWQRCYTKWWCLWVLFRRLFWKFSWLCQVCWAYNRWFPGEWSGRHSGALLREPYWSSSGLIMGPFLQGTFPLSWSVLIRNMWQTSAESSISTMGLSMFQMELLLLTVLDAWVQRPRCWSIAGRSWLGRGQSSSLWFRCGCQWCSFSPLWSEELGELQFDLEQRKSDKIFILFHG